MFFKVILSEFEIKLVNGMAAQVKDMYLMREQSKNNSTEKEVYYKPLLTFYLNVKKYYLYNFNVKKYYLQVTCKAACRITTQNLKLKKCVKGFPFL